MDEARTSTDAQGRPSVAPGVLTAIQIARGLTHVFLVFAGGSTLFAFWGRGSAGFVGPAVCIGLFAVSYFTWVALVLFGCMNFALSAMLWFVLGLGACLGLLMSGEGPLMLLGGLGLLIMVFATVIPVSRHDPTTPFPPPRKASKPDPGHSAALLLLILPIICFIFLMFDQLAIPLLLLVAVLALVMQVSAKHLQNRLDAESVDAARQSPQPYGPEPTGRFADHTPPLSGGRLP